MYFIVNDRVVPLSVFVSYFMIKTNILFFDSETRTFLKYIMMMPVASPSSCVLPGAFSKRHIEERTRTVQKDLVVLNIWCLLSTSRHPLHLFLSPFIAANCCPNKKSVIITLYSSNNDWIIFGFYLNIFWNLFFSYSWKRNAFLINQ